MGLLPESPGSGCRLYWMCGTPRLGVPFGCAHAKHLRDKAVPGIKIGTKPPPDYPGGPWGWDRITPKGDLSSEY
jgi:hypothetical protein